MGNTRRFKAGRGRMRLSQKEQIKRLTAQVGYQQGLNMALAAELEATKMERPPDLEDWVESVMPDLSDEERAELDGMSTEERESFLEQLGRQIKVSEALLAHPASDVSERVDPVGQDPEQVG